jgi:hypothetical protein
MRRIRTRRVGWLTGSIAIVATAALVTTIGAGASATTTNTVKHPHHARPSARAVTSVTTAYPVRGQSQEFGSNTNGFCPGLGNQPCDGNPNNGDYGTIDRVSRGFSNGGYGDYAPQTPAYFGNYMAVISGDTDGNQGAGCPQPSITEYCTGPYALFGTGAAQGAYNVFPAAGFTVTDDLYLSPTSALPAGQLVDNDVEINNSSGTYGSDDVVTSCYEGGGYVINYSSGSPGSCAGSPVVTADGWYRYVWNFSNVAGNAYVTMSVYSEPSLTQVWTSGLQTIGGGSAKPVSSWGGPGYLWFPTEDMSGLPLANVAVQLGQHATGYTP